MLICRVGEIIQSRINVCRVKAAMPGFTTNYGLEILGVDEQAREGYGRFVECLEPGLRREVEEHVTLFGEGEGEACGCCGSRCRGLIE